MASTTYEEVSLYALSPELQRITLWAEEQADLEIAKHALTGAELDAIEDPRRRVLQLETDMLLYGNCYVHNGERVEPLSRGGIKSPSTSSLTRLQSTFPTETRLS
jgi:hypothetical protein